MKSWPPRLEPLPFGPGNLEPLPFPFFVTVLVLVTIVAIPACHLCSAISLHHVIVRSARNRKLVWSAINRRQDACEIVVGWGRRRIPLERCRFPGIVPGLLAFEMLQNTLK